MQKDLRFPSYVVDFHPSQHRVVGHQVGKSVRFCFGKGHVEGIEVARGPGFNPKSLRPFVNSSPLRGTSHFQSKPPKRTGRLAAKNSTRIAI